MNEKIIILKSGRCAWGECFGCGWGRLVGPAPNMHQLKAVIDKEVTHAERLKVFASGSLLDDKQFPRSIRKYLAMRAAAAGVKELIIESRPEFITDENLADFRGIKTIVAIGLECADDAVLKRYNKGFTTEDYVRAAETLHKNGCGVRTYLMVGLPFVGDQSASLKKSVEFAREHSDSIVLINVFPHSKAPLYNMWIAGEWKPLSNREFSKLTAPYEDCEKESNNFAFIPNFHEKPAILGATEAQLTHPYYEVWQDYIVRLYEPPKDKDALFFVPCAFRKPYFKSKLHKAIASVATNPRLHWVAISSPGVIPYEFAGKYPFNAYDWPEWEETPEIKKRYIEVTQARIERFLEEHGKHYKKICSYFKPDSESFKALEAACKKLGLPLMNCISKETYEKIKTEKNPLSLPEALEDLKRAISRLFV
ncbi:MAG: DUF5591 domain-containing protein [Candidatus Aenigmatarchaeota archaeon]